MSGDVFNLNKVRKAKAKAENRAKSAVNRSVFGRTKAERSAAKLQADKASRTLDGHKRTPADAD